MVGINTYVEKEGGAAKLQRLRRIRSGLFLALIYASFISLGLPDSLLGSAWPVMQSDLDVPYTFAGIASMVTAGGTIVASFFGGSLIQRLGTGNLTRVSVAMTALALLGISQVPSFGWLILWAIPLGLGGGAVDAALNHFVATHYKAHHMNWLHCFWGVGAMTGPLIMARFIAVGSVWRGGYLTVGLIQASLLAILLVSIRLWREMEQGATLPQAAGADGSAVTGSRSLGGVLRLPGIYPVLIAYLLYTGIELTVGLWGSSFLAKARALGPVEAAFGTSVFFGSLTLGRMVSGFLSMRMSEAALVRSGLLTIVAGGVVMFAFAAPAMAVFSLALVGLGCAPIYPAMLHQTPRRFGPEWAPTLMGIQMAVAYTGATFLPPLFGWITAGQAMGLLPIVVLIYAAVMLVSTELANRTLQDEAPASLA